MSKRPIGWGFRACAAAACIVATQAGADTFNVTSTADDGSPGTLRWAMLQVNSTAGSDTINIGPGTITLLSGLPGFTETVLVQGAGQGTTVVEGGPAPQSSGVNWRIFGVPAGANVTIRDLTARNGVCEVVGPGTAFSGGIHNGGTLTLENVTVSGNRVLNVGTQATGNTSQGGGIANSGVLTIINCTVANNVAFGGTGNPTGGLARGGGIYSGPTSTLTILNSTISGNEVQGGGASGGPGQGGNGTGGGVHAEPGAVVEIRNSTISGNRATEGLAPVGTHGVGMGGGVYAGSGSDHAISILMSTISGNTAGSTGGTGGGIYGGPGLTVDSCTVTENVCPLANSGGGIATTIVAVPGGPLVRNTILSGNIAGTSSEDIAGRVNGLGFVLASFFAFGGELDTTSPGNTPTGNILGTNATLGSLAENGGPTRTHALLPGSLGVNSGTDSFIALGTATTDQRGFPRVSIGQVQRGGAQADIGAYELQGPGSSVVGFDAYD